MWYNLFGLFVVSQHPKEVLITAKQGNFLFLFMERVFVECISSELIDAIFGHVTAVIIYLHHPNVALVEVVMTRHLLSKDTCSSWLLVTLIRKLFTRCVVQKEWTTKGFGNGGTQNGLVQRDKQRHYLMVLRITVSVVFFYGVCSLTAVCCLSRKAISDPRLLDENKNSLYPF